MPLPGVTRRVILPEIELFKEAYSSHHSYSSILGRIFGGGRRKHLSLGEHSAISPSSRGKSLTQRITHTPFPKGSKENQWICHKLSNLSYFAIYSLSINSTQDSPTPAIARLGRYTIQAAAAGWRGGRMRRSLQRPWELAAALKSAGPPDAIGIAVPTRAAAVAGTSIGAHRRPPAPASPLATDLQPPRPSAHCSPPSRTVAGRAVAPVGMPRCRRAIVGRAPQPREQLKRNGRQVAGKSAHSLRPAENPYSRPC